MKATFWSSERSSDSMTARFARSERSEGDLFRCASAVKTLLYDAMAQMDAFLETDATRLHQARHSGEIAASSKFEWHWQPPTLPFAYRRMESSAPYRIEKHCQRQRYRNSWNSFETPSRSISRVRDCSVQSSKHSSDPDATLKANAVASSRSRQSNACAAKWSPSEMNDHGRDEQFGRLGSNQPLHKVTA